MPWCPKCGCEYRSEVKLCADCGHELVDEDPNPPAPTAMPVRWPMLLELGSLCALAPFVLYFLAAALSHIAAMVDLSFACACLCVFSAAWVYGRRRTIVDGDGLWIGSQAASACMQVLLCVVLVLVGVIPKPYKLFFGLPIMVVFSAIVSCIIWFAATSRKQNP